MNTNITSYVNSLLTEKRVILVEETDCKKKLWKKFRRIYCLETEDYAFKDKYRNRGKFAVCSVCFQVCELGPRGGTSELEQHNCPEATVQELPSYQFAEAAPVKDKNQTENERKERIRDLIKDAAALILGEETNLPQLTLALLIWAAVSEIPSTILQFLTDGKSPEQRPLAFYEKLGEVLDELFRRFKLAEFEAANYHQQQVKLLSGVTESKDSSSLHLHLVHPADNQITITWFPENAEFDRINMIGRNLSELIHPIDYPEIANRLLQKSDDGSFVEKDFSFPQCRIIKKPTRPRQRTIADYRTVFLTGHIRQIIRTPPPRTDQRIAPAYTYSPWPRLASFIHIATYYQYMTLHSLDGRIIQVDKRITMVTGYKCDEVINQPAHDFIDDQFTTTVRKKHFSWIEGGGQASVTFPLKAKNGEILYLKSRGEFIYYRNSSNEVVQGFILNNCRIHEEEHIAEDGMNDCSNNSSIAYENINNVSLPQTEAIRSPSEDSFYSSTSPDSSFNSVDYSSHETSDFNSSMMNNQWGSNSCCPTAASMDIPWDARNNFQFETSNIINYQPQEGDWPFCLLDS